MIPTNSPLIQALSPYTAADVLTSSEVTFSFMNPGISFDAGDVDGQPRTSLTWTEVQKDTVRDLFTYISTVVNLTFREVPAGTTGVNIEFAQIASYSDTTTGISIPFGPGISRIVVPTEYADLDDVTLIHEIGHSLGLSHPFDGPSNLPGVSNSGDLGTFELNTELATRMSYLPGATADHPGLDITGESSAFGALDIAALQLLYGENTTTGLGDTVYTNSLTLLTIWDNGGTDTIDFSAATTQAVIDLRAASLALEPGGGGYLSYIGLDNNTLANGGFTIAFGVEIENGIGGSADDTLNGNTLANVLTGGGGNDMLNGGGGTDTAVYTGPQQSYTLTVSSAGISITDRRSDGDGTDQLQEIEALRFGDSTEAPFELAIFDGAAAVSGNQIADLVELWIAYFDRSPAATGLHYWATRLGEGMTLPEIAESFFVQPETQRTYEAFLDEQGQVTNTQAFVTAVFNNLLGRDPSSSYWVNELERPGTEITPAIFILAVVNGAKAPTGGEADAAFLQAKTDLGVYFAAIKGLAGYDNTVNVMQAFNGSQDSVTAAVRQIDTLYSAALDATSGDFLFPLVGVVDDPFATMV